MQNNDGGYPGSRGALALGVLALGLAACGDEEIGRRSYPVTAYCKVTVVGRGTKAMETDYIPHVVACENGGADTEALKAQAVAARTFAYYKLRRGANLRDGTSDQVYSCSRKPSAKHYAAAKATSGKVLYYKGKPICSFFVAGAKPSTSTCKARSSDSDPTHTERYVTYNEGKSGSGITQSSLGWISPSNYANRGCLSQNGSNCLSLKGRGYEKILRYYYGSDIQLVQTTGSCITVPKPDSSVAPRRDSGAAKPSPDAGVARSDAMAGTDAWSGDLHTGGGDGRAFDPGAATPNNPAAGGAGTPRELIGNCALGPDGPGEPGVGLLLLALLWLRRRHR